MISKYTGSLIKQKPGLFGNKIILLFLLFSQLNVNSQSCNILPSPITGSASIAACDLTSNTTIQSGDVLSISLTGGREYTFEVCYNPTYDQPDLEFSQIQLWTSHGGFINEANGDANSCSSITYNSCTDEIVLLQAFTHSCIANWKKWDLNIKSKCCSISCQDAVHLSASSALCTSEIFNIPTPTFNGVCLSSTLSYTTNLPFPPVGAATPPSLAVPAGNPVGTYEITWELEDCLGNSKICKQDIIIDPVLACDDLVTINLTGPKAQVTIGMVIEAVPALCYPDYELEVYYQGENLDNMVCCEHIGKILTYTITHISTGLSCNGEISVEDKFAPLITCEDKVIKCTESTEPDSLGYPDLVENCDPDVDLVYYDDYENYNCVDPIYIGRITRTWIATDAAGFNNTCVQYIDILKANLTGVTMPVDTTIACKDVVTDMEETGMPLYCDLPISHYCNMVTYTKDDTTYLCENSFKIYRQWTVLDWCSGLSLEQTQLIEIIDDVPPILVCPKDLTVGTVVDFSCSGTVNLPNIESARDVCTSAPMVEPSWEFGLGFGPFHNVPVGVHEVDYVVTDDCGNSSICTIEVTVEDDDRPTAICDLYTQLSIPSAGSAEICPEDIDTGSHDNCAIQSMELALMSDSIFMSCLKFECADAGNTEMIILRVFDDSGMYNDCMVEVEIVDKVAPALHCPSDITIDCLQDETDLNLTGMAQAFDSCIDTIYFQDENFLTECRTGEVKRIWYAEDESGNVSNCIQTITLIDNTAAIITFGRDTTLSCETIDDDYGRPVVEDDCGIYAMGYVDEYLIDDDCVQKLLRTWTVLNECSGLDTSATILIKLFNDRTLPEFSGAPTEIRVSCEDPLPDFIAPIITDTCDDDLEIEICTGEGSRPVCEEEGIMIQIWKVTDACGNYAEFEQRILIIDDQAPVFSNIPSNLNLSCDDDIPFVTPSVSDNCDDDIEFVLVVTETAGSCSQEFSIERTWTATDNCGNVSEITQLITISDSNPPFFIGIPSDLTLDCNDEIPNLVPGFDDNCDADVTLYRTEEIIEGDCPDEREILRTFVIEDACGNKDSLVWSILILDNTAPIFDPGNFDPNPVISCDQGLPPISALFTDNCDAQPTINITIDSTGTQCERIINRTIRATDRCGNSTEIRQVITSIDNTPPSVLFRPPFLIESDTTICITNIRMESIIFQDNCDEDLNVFYEINYNSDGYIFDAGLAFTDTLIQGNNASGQYPIGNHMVTFTAEDACGNSIKEDIRIEISERKFPLIGCVSNEFFINTDGTVTVNSNQVINADVTYDECTPIDIQFADDFFGTNLFGNELTFTCDDIGLNLAFIVAIDSFGNTSACLNQIEISDPNGNCGNRPDDGFIVGGRITNEEMTVMSDVKVNLGINEAEVTSTGTYGLYHFLEVFPGDNCSVLPENNINHLEGVTTFDLVLLQKHIIGSSILNSPYKIIAADVNRSGTISTLDLVILRQLILFQRTELPNNTSWRFIPADYTFSDPSNPFLDNFSEAHTCYDIQNSELNVNFIAIKIGDLNCSSRAQFKAEEASQRNPEPLVHLELGNEKLEAGKTYHVPVQLNTVLDISALQFTLQLDESLSLEGIEIDENVSNCVHIDKSQNLIHFAWTSFDKVASDLFKIKVRAEKDAFPLDQLFFSKEFINASAYQANGQALKIGLRDNRELSNEDYQENTKEGLNISQNKPNPFRTDTNIEIYTTQEEEISFSVYNSNGQILFEKDYQLQVGENSISFKRNNLPSGVYFYKVQTAKEEITKKMMILDF